MRATRASRPKAAASGPRSDELRRALRAVERARLGVGPLQPLQLDAEHPRPRRRPRPALPDVLRRRVQVGAPRSSKAPRGKRLSRPVVARAPAPRQKCRGAWARVTIDRCRRRDCKRVVDIVDLRLCSGATTATARTRRPSGARSASSRSRSSTRCTATRWSRSPRAGPSFKRPPPSARVQPQLLACVSLRTRRLRWALNDTHRHVLSHSY